MAKEQVSFPQIHTMNLSPIGKLVVGLYKFHNVSLDTETLSNSYLEYGKLILDFLENGVLKNKLTFGFLLNRKGKSSLNDIYLLVARNCITKKCVKKTREIIHNLVSFLKIFGLKMKKRGGLTQESLVKCLLRKRKRIIVGYSNLLLINNNYINENSRPPINQELSSPILIDKVRSLLSEIFPLLNSFNDLILYFIFKPTNITSPLKKLNETGQEKSFKGITFLIGMSSDETLLLREVSSTFLSILNLIELKGFRKKENRGISVLRSIAHLPFLVNINKISITTFYTLWIFLLKFLSMWAPKNKIEELKFDPVNNRVKGDIYVGEQIVEGMLQLPFYLNIEDLDRHVLIVGPSGKGKTRLSLQIISEIADKKLGNVWILDFHGEYAFLTGRGFTIVKPGSPMLPLALNIFDKIGEDPNSFSNYLARLFLEVLKAQDYELTPQMERALSEAIFDTITSEKSVLRNPLGFLTNLRKWYNKATSLGFASPLSTFHAIINRFQSLFTGPMASVLWVFETNLDLERLLDRNVIFDLSILNQKGVSKIDMSIFVNILLRFLFNQIVRYNSSDNRIYLIIEEARYLVPWRVRKSAADTTALEDFAILARKYGLSLITITQSFDSVSRDILDNVGTIFFFGSENIEELKRISIEQVRDLDLPPRYALVHLSAVPATVMIKVKEVNLEYGTNFNKQAKENLLDVFSRLYKPILINFNEVISLLELSREEGDIENLVRDYMMLSEKLANLKACNRSILVGNFAINLIVKMTSSGSRDLSLYLQKIRDRPRDFLREYSSIKNLSLPIDINDIWRCIEQMIYVFELFSKNRLKWDFVKKYELEDLVSHFIAEYYREYSKKTN